MKVIKRNGSEAKFDIKKIVAALDKANNSVDESSRMTEEENPREQDKCKSRK